MANDNENHNENHNDDSSPDKQNSASEDSKSNSLMDTITGSDESDDSSSLMDHLVRKGIPVLVLVLVAIGAYFYLRQSGQAPSEHKGGHHGGPPPRVTVLKIKAQTVPLHPEFLGQTAASRIVQVRARITGFLDKRLFKEGTQVKKGDLLYQIDPKQYKADLQAAKASLQADKATLQQARQQLKRYQKLVRENAATLSELENWQARVGVANANISKDKANIDQAQLNLGYTRINARMTGIIGATQINVGSYVNAGTNSLLDTIQKTDPIYVTYTVSENQWLRWQSMVRHGQIKLPKNGQLQVSLTLGDGSEYPHHGYIDFVATAINTSTGTAMVRAVVPNPHHTLRPGQYVHVHILGINQQNTILVPQGAVLQDPSGSSVYLVNKKNQVTQHEVTLGQWYEKQWQIESGVQPGDQVLIDHLVTVQPGMKVKPTVKMQKSATTQSAATQSAATQNTATQTSD